MTLPDGEPANLEDQVAWWRAHAEALDRNWAAHSDGCLASIRGELRGCPTTNRYGEATTIDDDSSVPEMVEAIRRLKATAAAGPLGPSQGPDAT